MKRTEAMRQWLEQFMAANGGGKVTVDRQDGIPGSCCLTYLGTRQLEQEWTLTPAIRLRKRSHYRITYLGGTPGYNWLEALENWVVERMALQEGPLFEEGPFANAALACVTMENSRIDQVDPAGTVQYSADLFAEYTAVYRPDNLVGDLVILDEEPYWVEVVSLQREFALGQAVPEAVTLDGKCHRELLGTYYHYTMTIRSREDQGELERFWEKISQPVESILCSFPYGTDVLTQRMYVESGTQQLRDTYNERKWGDITVRFLGLEPKVVA